MEYNDCGKIVQTHGIKGEVKVKTDSSFVDERFKVGATLYIKSNKGYKPLVVKSHRSMLNYELVSFEGLESIDDVMPYLSKILYAEKDKNLLKENEHFYSDLIDLNVSYFNNIVGKVIRIDALPQCDYLIIKLEKDEKEKMVPLLDEFIDSIDDENKVIYITDMEGLL
ncbi:16S rRNA processing protein RimM [bacterium]|nr:16S rRNA processing protein RimM [bacterium]